MINDQKYIANELKKLETMIPLSSKRLDKLIAIIIGIIISQSVTVSKIAQELKSSYSCALESSKIKKINRFLNNKFIHPENLYEFFIYNFFKHYKPNSKMIYIIFNHTTILDKFLISQFCLKVGKRAISLQNCIWSRRVVYDVNCHMIT